MQQSRAVGVGVSSSYYMDKPATYNGFQTEYVAGSLIDVGVAVGLNGLSSAPANAPDKSLGFSIPWLGKYTGGSVNFKGDSFDGIDLGLGLGVSSPINYTTPLKTFLDKAYGKQPDKQEKRK
ncbi:hypothetical protein [Acinetobacter venetianus]|uniref:hypothetical protein n=1 Tax=Acinetobacter venetianus TaxID=52133 RepID=UPI00214FD76F|nr:hypothetical protein [Acinetobacter venetianus]MCR4532798.1 hypothetical protein [Acinetobacter venetianus]MDA0696897.1 hypothetical protein [Pseudomonadota bacterium]MDA1255128.1 hypothetical protein [Pseudomonadota bacterium]